MGCGKGAAVGVGIGVSLGGTYLALLLTLLILHHKLKKEERKLEEDPEVSASPQPLRPIMPRRLTKPRRTGSQKARELKEIQVAQVRSCFRGLAEALGPIRS